MDIILVLFMINAVVIAYVLTKSQCRRLLQTGRAVKKLPIEKKR
ncbi:hypothetical protein ACEQPO_31155 [Bacillus sp. SL00103]